MRIKYEANSHKKKKTSKLTKLDITGRSERELWVRINVVKETKLLISGGRKESRL